MRFVELFAGADGMGAGFESAGWECVARAEIEPHARAVLRFRRPGPLLLGDVVALTGGRKMGRWVRRQLPAVDVVSGGSPCQDLSVAGKRAGLAGGRSSLFYRQVRLWRMLGAPYLIWENVPGAFSSNEGRDFAAVLSTIVGSAIAVPSDGWKRSGVAAGRDAVAAWRVLDLQHFGPPQRRARVFIVAARAGGIDPAEILALGESVCGHPSPREQSRQDVAGTIAARTRGGGGLGTDFELGGGVVVGALDVNDATKWGSNQWVEQGKGIAQPLSGGDVVGTLLQRGDSSPSVDRGQPHVVQPLKAQGQSFGSGEGYGAPVIVDGAQITSPTNRSQPRPGVSHPVAGSGGAPLVIAAHGQANAEICENGAPSLTLIHEAPILYAGARPRRLTPLECERLMGWPDEWTRTGIDANGRRYELSDTARHRLCGNGVGSPVAQWIASQFAAVSA